MSIYQYLVTGDPRDPCRLVDQLTHEETARDDAAPILEARGLVKRYGQVVALDGADFDLYPGEILAIIGDNGAGKSTLIKALSGALQPDEGEILLDGEPVHFTLARSTPARPGSRPSTRTSPSRPALDIASNLFLGRELRRRGPLGLVLRMLDNGGCAARRRRARRAEDRHPVD